MKTADIALSIPTKKLFEYFIPKDINLSTGMRVIVPLRNREVIGIVVKINKKIKIHENKIRYIIKNIDDNSLFTENLLNFLIWIIKYYHLYPGKFLLSVLPKYLKKSVKINNNNFISNKQNYNRKIKSEEKNIDITYFRSTDKQYKKKLFLKFLKKHKFSVFFFERNTILDNILIFNAIFNSVISLGKQVLILVPKIYLISKLSTFLKKNFSIPVFELHSKINEIERFKIWLDIKNGKCAFVIGIRSALFIPFLRLGLIVVENEHDDLYKDFNKLRFNIRNLAITLAKINNIPIILNTLTPSIETCYNLENNKYYHINLTEDNNIEPIVRKEIINIHDFEVFNFFSDNTLKVINNYIKLKKNILIFTKKIGLICKNCGLIFKCNFCDNAYILNKNVKKILCYICKICIDNIPICFKCKSNKFKLSELKSNIIINIILNFFEKSKIISLNKNYKLNRKINKNKNLHSSKNISNIFINTQLSYELNYISFINLLVLDVDNILFSKDFRYCEKFTQNYHQIIKIIQNNKNNNQIIIQTQYPQNIFFKLLVNNSYFDTANYILKERKQFMLPPFINHILIIFSILDKIQYFRFLDAFRKVIKCYLKDKNFFTTGPNKLNISKNKKKIFYYFLLSHILKNELHKIINNILPKLDNIAKFHKINFFLDIDPVLY